MIIIVEFIIYSVIGFILESLYVSILKKKVYFSGLLKGPFIPLYGFGAFIILKVAFYDDLLTNTFFYSVIIGTTLEYLTHYFLEKDLKIQLWNYSHFRFTFSKRICLFYSLCWGFLGVLLVGCIHPLIQEILTIFNPLYLNLFCFACFIYITIQFYRLKKKP